MTLPDAARRRERAAFRVAVFVLSAVPIAAGSAGVVLGAGFASLADGPGTPDADSHFRYLSGLLLGIGIAFPTTVAGRKVQSARFRLLALIVILGGLARLLSAVTVGLPGPAHQAALVMELGVTPALALWSLRL
ncbi:MULTISPECIES: DUF4345 domain-containing protein [unclassified Roseitalea]|uniref:DUF4345 domain-containing protein n=1 Tax=unclassified Roseitalea TaxID=2639107 RepID=UPI00274013CB|nr:MULTISPECIES: DUF4345 domain-containing protein [unclassified Roseitalea]